MKKKHKKTLSCKTITAQKAHKERQTNEKYLLNPQKLFY